MKITRIAWAACFAYALAWLTPPAAIAQTPTAVCDPVNPSHCVKPDGIGNMPPSDPYQYSSAGASQSQLSVTTASPVPLTVPSGATSAIIGVRSGAASSVNYCYDGTTAPTTGATGACSQLSAGQTVSVQGANLLANFKAIAATASTAIDVAYLK